MDFDFLINPFANLFTSTVLLAIVANSSFEIYPKSLAISN